MNSLIFKIKTMFFKASTPRGQVRPPLAARFIELGVGKGPGNFFHANT